MILAVLLLGEQRELGLSFYSGVAIIVVAVFAHPLLVPAAPPRPETLAVAESRGLGD